LRAYRQLLTSDARRAGRTEEETGLLLRRLYSSAWRGVADGVLRQETVGFAAWSYRKPCFPVTCEGIRRRGQNWCDAVCANGRCVFAETLRTEANQVRQEQRTQDRFEELHWREVLVQLHGGSVGQAAAACYIALRERMVELDLDYTSTILMSMRQFQSSIGEHVALGLVCAAVGLLTTERGHGLVERTVKGQAGRPEKNQAGKSSGYKICLPTPRPPGDLPSAGGEE
jgi:hypothetical protein